MGKSNEIISKQEIESLKQNMFSDDWELVKSSADKLGEIGGEEITDFLISLLKSENSGLRNRAALALEEIKNNRAVEPLLEAIFKKENHNYNGTMVFALESLDCSRNLKDIFRILFYESFEAKISAYRILTEQKFDFTQEDLTEIKQMFDGCKSHPDKCPCFEDEKIQTIIQEAVEAYLSLLK
jgi:hypothetical protein